MKKAALILMMVALLASSCYRSHNSITVSDGSSYLKIEYSGTIVFNDDSTKIVRISPGGYFKCKSNDDKLSIESDRDGNLHYEVNGDEESSILSAAGQALMQQATHEIARQRNKKHS